MKFRQFNGFNIQSLQMLPYFHLSEQQGVNTQMETYEVSNPIQEIGTSRVKNINYT